MFVQATDLLRWWRLYQAILQSQTFFVLPWELVVFSSATVEQWESQADKEWVENRQRIIRGNCVIVPIFPQISKIDFSFPLSLSLSISHFPN